MFKDVTYPVTIAKAAFSDDDHSQTIDVRLDVDVPVGEYRRFNSIIGAIVSAVSGNDSGFSQMQFRQVVPTYDLTFAPNVETIKGGALATSINGVAFDKQLIIVRRVDKKSSEESFVLQLRTKLKKTDRNVELIQNYFKQDCVCRFFEAQTDLLEDDGEEESEDEDE